MKKGKRKVVKLGFKAQNLANRKHIGEEPEFPFGKKLGVGELVSALNWYSVMCDVGQARQFLANVSGLEGVNDDFFPKTAAWIQRIQDRGADVPIGDITTKDRLIREALARVKPAQEPIEKVTVERGARGKDHIAEFDAALDARDSNFSAYTYLQANSVPVSHAVTILEYYRPQLAELVACAKGDKELQEAYKSHGKEGFKQLFLYVSNVCKDLDRYINATKAAKPPRKPRKKKAIDPNKVIGSLKYKTEDDTLKVKSVSPLSIIGATELWCFNTKYTTLTVYRATEGQTFTVKGTTLLGFDEKASMTKRVGRKTEYALEQVLKGGKIVRRKLMDEFKSEATVPTGRINGDVLLLKVA